MIRIVCKRKKSFHAMRIVYTIKVKERMIMAIQVKEGKETLFTIQTKHPTYQMKTDAYGVLQHLWYGATIKGDMS